MTLKCGGYANTTMCPVPPIVHTLIDNLSFKVERAPLYKSLVVDEHREILKFTPEKLGP